jgi:hypothetical protein
MARFSGSLLCDGPGRPIACRSLVATVLVDPAVQNIPAVHAPPASHPRDAAQIFHVSESFLDHQAVASMAIH